MRLLICASEYYPYGAGIANVAYNVVEQLRKMGIECIVCSPSGDIKLGNSKLIERFGIIGLLYYWHRVNKYFKKNNFDLVWLHNPLFLENSSHLRSVVTIHSTYYGKMNQKLKPQIYYKLASKIESYCLNNIRFSTKFIAVSAQVYKELEKIGIDRKRISLILNGVDTEKFKFTKNKEIRAELGLENSYIILYVGRLARSKFVDTIIKSMPFILNELNNVKLLIIGDGPQRVELINLARSLNVYNSIIICGSKPNDEIPIFYSIADLVVCPYSGLVLFEAMSQGKPIVAFDIEWHSEVITNMENGLLVENLNLNEFSRAIIKLLKNKGLSDKLGMRARDYALKNLDWKIIAGMYLDEFEKGVIR